MKIKNPFLLAARGICLSAVLFYISTNSTSAQTTSDQTLVENLVTNGLDMAFNAHDAKALSENFAEDGDFTNVRGTSVHGRKAIDDFHAPLFATMFKNAHTRTVSIQVRFLRPDIATVDFHWEMTGATFPDGTPFPNRKGLANATVEKRGGKWLVAVLHNTDLTESRAPARAKSNP